MKKYLAFILAFILLFSISAPVYADNYKPVTWTLDKYGTLTITCKGDMPDYTGDPAPWCGKKNAPKVKEVIINEGCTHIGDEAFEYCENLEWVTLPSTLESIGNYAFFHCGKLKDLEYPWSLKSIGASCFDHCSSLLWGYIPDGCKEIGQDTFNCCSSMVTVYIGKDVRAIRLNAFNGCKKLDVVAYGGSAEDWQRIDIENDKFGGNDYLLNTSIECDFRF